jgi:hypothetical protein
MCCLMFRSKLVVGNNKINHGAYNFSRNIVPWPLSRSYAEVRPGWNGAIVDVWSLGRWLAGRIGVKKRR